MVIISMIRAISSQAPKGVITYGEGSEIAWLGGRLLLEACLRYDPSAAKAGRLNG